MSLRFALILLAGCAAPPPPAATRAPRAPATVAIDVVDGEPLPGTRLTLRARVDKQGSWDAPITIDWQVPPGARLVGGASRAILSGDAADVTLELQALPAEDVVVVASSQTEAAGFHAEARYRFGRPAPVKAAPPRDGETVTTPSGVDLGAPVPVKP